MTPTLTHRPRSPESEQAARERAEKRAAEQIARMEAARGYIAENACRGVSLEQAAAFAGLSTCHFSREFHKATGATFKATVAAAQVAEAKRLILADVPLAEVAQRCGFATQSHLCSRFRQSVGLPPLRWKRKHEAEFPHGGTTDRDCETDP